MSDFIAARPHLGRGHRRRLTRDSVRPHEGIKPDRRVWTRRQPGAGGDAGRGGAIHTDGNTYIVMLSGVRITDNHADAGGLPRIFFFGARAPRSRSRR